MKYNIDKLPQWAQSLIYGQHMEILSLKEMHNTEMQNIRQAHELLTKYDWTTAGVHTPEKHKLWVLHKDNPVCIASIGDGDILLLGHKTKKKAGKQ